MRIRSQCGTRSARAPLALVLQELYRRRHPRGRWGTRPNHRAGWGHRRGAAVKCSQCGTENPAGQKFCGECGGQLAGAASEAQPSASSLGTGAATGDRRLVGRYGGTIDKFMGDEVMALFGAPQAHENDPERALRAALEMRQALEAFNRQRQVGLTLHFGVNTGLVYAGGVGGGERNDYSVMGDAVNIASRLKGLAKPGEVVVGANTYRQAGHLFKWAATDQAHVKGKAEPLTVYRLVEACDAPGTGRQLQGTRGISSPLVGRDTEVALFGQALDRLHGREGGIVTVIGEAGLGKSRLVAEVRKAVGGEGPLARRPHSLLRQDHQLLALPGAAAGRRGHRERRRRGRALGEARPAGEALFGGETPDILPYLATFLNLPVPEELQDKVRYLDGEARGRQVFRSTGLFVSRMAKERPLVLIFEDVHWLDGSSVELLEHLLPLSRAVPVLFCLVGRPEPDSTTQRLRQMARETHADRYQEIVLAPLLPEETQALVSNLGDSVACL